LPDGAKAKSAAIVMPAAVRASGCMSGDLAVAGGGNG
jgi:hypothetical protein